MDVYSITLKEISGELLASWSSMQEGNSSLQGPCFRPELFLAFAKNDERIQLAVFSEGGERGFLPYLKEADSKIAWPIAGCDYQMIIDRGSRTWDVKQILKKLGLTAWNCQHLVNYDHLKPDSSAYTEEFSPLVDIRGGYEAYEDFLKKKPEEYKRLIGMREKVEKKLGKIRFLGEDQSLEHLQQILTWRSKRYLEGKPHSPSFVKTLENLFNLKTPSFSGVFSTLFAGEHFLAGVFSVRSQGVLYYWIPAFNPEFSEYSPGKLLIHRLLQELESLGCAQLDFGPGGEPYKKYFSNSGLPYVGKNFELITLRSVLKKCRTFFISKLKLIKNLIRNFIIYITGETGKKALAFIRKVLRRLKVHPYALIDTFLTYPRFLGSIKPSLIGGTEEEMRSRLQALDSRWWKARIQAPIGKRILVISPHPDDESIGAGGLLLAHRGKAEIHIINVFQGNDGGMIGETPWQNNEEYQEKLVRIRRKELELTGRDLGVSSIQFLGLKDSSPVSNLEVAQRLKDMVTQIKPDVVLLPWFLDNYFDHQAVNMLFASTCSEIECMIFGYEIWSLCTPNAIFDITEYLEEKMNLVRNYKSQISAVDYVGYARGLAHTRAFLYDVSWGNRLGAAEGFLSMPNKDYCDLVRTLFGTLSKPTQTGKKFL